MSRELLSHVERVVPALVEALHGTNELVSHVLRLPQEIFRALPFRLPL